MFRIINAFLILLFFIACAENQDTMQNKDAASKVNRIPVEIKIAKRQKIEQKVPMPGVIKPIHSVDVAAEVSGKIIKIYKNLGQVVTTQDTLAIIDDIVPESLFRQARAQVLSAKNNLDIARLNLTSDEELFNNGDISKLQYENSVLASKNAKANHLLALANLKLAEKNFLNTRIVPSVNGIISRKYIEPGTMVTNGMAVYRVVDIKTLKIEVGVPQKIINLLSIGSHAEIKIDALKNQIFEGVVRHISPEADKNTGNFLTEIHLSNTPQKTIRAGMTADISLLLKNSDNEIVVPDYTIVSEQGNQFIYKINHDKAQLTPISVRGTNGSDVIIESGVEEGDSLVIVGIKNLGVNTPVWIEHVHN